MSDTSPDAVPPQPGCKEVVNLTLILYYNIIQKRMYAQMDAKGRGQKIIKEGEIVSWE